MRGLFIIAVVMEIRACFKSVSTMTMCQAVVVLVTKEILILLDTHLTGRIHGLLPYQLTGSSWQAVDELRCGLLLVTMRCPAHSIYDNFVKTLLFATITLTCNYRAAVMCVSVINM